jgi:hypothetical protein
MRSSNSVQPLLEPVYQNHFECLLVLDTKKWEMKGSSASSGGTMAVSIVAALSRTSEARRRSCSRTRPKKGVSQPA